MKEKLCFEVVQVRSASGSRKLGLILETC